MPPKMDERLDALEVRMTTMENFVKTFEGSLNLILEEFRQSILSEFAKLEDRRSPNKAMEKLMLENPDPDPLNVEIIKEEPLLEVIKVTVDGGVEGADHSESESESDFVKPLTEMEKKQENDDDDVEKGIKEGGSNHPNRPGLLGLGLLSENRPKSNTVHFQGSNLKPLSSFGSSSASSRPDPVLPSEPPAPPDPPDPPKLLSLESQERTDLTKIPPEPPDTNAFAAPEATTHANANWFISATPPCTRTREVRSTVAAVGKGEAAAFSGEERRKMSTAERGGLPKKSDLRAEWVAFGLGPTLDLMGLAPFRLGSLKCHPNGASRTISFGPSLLGSIEFLGPNYMTIKIGASGTFSFVPSLLGSIEFLGPNHMATKIHGNTVEGEESLDSPQLAAAPELPIMSTRELKARFGFENGHKINNIDASVIQNHFLKKAKVAKWGFNASGLEELFALANEKVMPWYSSVVIKQWDPGKSNISMVVTAYEDCWRSSLIFYGLINFVFDRGKIWEIQNELLPNLSSLNKLIPIWFSSKLMPLPNARRAIENYFQP